MRGSISQADAMFVNDPPHTTINGTSVSSRSASLTIASAAAVQRGSEGLDKASLAPGNTRTSFRSASMATWRAAASESLAQAGDHEGSYVGTWPPITQRMSTLGLSK